MAGVYGVAAIPGSNQITQQGRTAEEFLWENGRVSMLWLNGVDHAWSGGQGASGSYISGAGSITPCIWESTLQPTTPELTVIRRLSFPH